MIFFLIQSENGLPKFDFGFHLIKAIQFNNWYYKNDEYIFRLFEGDSKLPEGYIPIGSVEFVTKYIENFFNKTPLPKNVPECLFKFANREIKNGTEEDVKRLSFVKSNDTFKGFTEICSNPPKGNYQISEIINIESEWRVFVYRGNIVGLKNYCGDFKINPNYETIEEIVAEYEKNNAPIAYTVDIGINDTGTFIIEVHDFFSCGLYGFDEYNILPNMFFRWFNEFVKI
jgi:hypothetical protein